MGSGSSVGGFNSSSGGGTSSSSCPSSFGATAWTSFYAPSANQLITWTCFLSLGSFKGVGRAVRLAAQAFVPTFMY